MIFVREFFAVVAKWHGFNWFVSSAYALVATVDRVWMPSSLLLETDMARWSGSHSRPSDCFISSEKHSKMKSDADDVSSSSSAEMSFTRRLDLLFYALFARRHDACKTAMLMHPLLLLLRYACCHNYTSSSSSFFLLIIRSDSWQWSDAIQNMQEHNIFGIFGTRIISWLYVAHSVPQQ